MNAQRGEQRGGQVNVSRYRYSESTGHCSIRQYDYRKRATGARQTVIETISAAITKSGDWRVTDGGMSMPASLYFKEAK